MSNETHRISIIMRKYQLFSSALSLILIVQSNWVLSTQADNECYALKDLNYKQFGTKTIYESAIKSITDKTNYLPKSFDKDSLEEEDKKLRNDSCRPLAFYFVGRHSARFPDSEGITQYNNDLYGLIETIKMNGSCQKELKELLEWRSKMQPDYDNLVTELGNREEQSIAGRFKSIYPDFFNASISNVHIGVTNKLRTAQTAAQFLHSVDDFKLDDIDWQSVCKSLPTDNVDDPNYSVEKVSEAACYRQLIKKHQRKPILEFHEECAKYSGKIKNTLVDRIKSPNFRKPIADRVAKRLGFHTNKLNKNNAIEAVTPEVLESIFSMCKYEIALKKHSVWCKLFSDEEIRALDYLEDAKIYIKSAYGPNAKLNARQSCPLVKDLLEAFEDAIRANDDKKRSYFYFSHAEPMKKIQAAFGLFHDSDSYSEERIGDFERKLKVPGERQWRSSVTVPFSANMAFILYRCQGQTTEYKILSTVTEKPVKLGGCKGTVCKSDDFFNTYEHMRDCDLSKICSKSA